MEVVDEEETKNNLFCLPGTSARERESMERKMRERIILKCLEERGEGQSSDYNRLIM